MSCTNTGSGWTKKNYGSTVHIVMFCTHTPGFYNTVHLEKEGRRRQAFAILKRLLTGIE
jgi:phage baseplate assembly protein W